MVDEEDLLHPRSRRRPRPTDPQVPGRAHPFVALRHGVPGVPEGRRRLLGRRHLLARSPLRLQLRENTVSQSDRDVLRRFADPDLEAVGRREPDRGRRSRRRSGRRTPDDPAGHGCEPRVTRLGVRRGRAQPPASGRPAEGGDGRPRLVRSDDGGTTWRVLGQPVRGRRCRPAGTCAARALAETARTAASSRSSSPSTRRPRPAAVQPGHRGARPRSEPRRALRRRRCDVVGALGARRTAGTSSTRARVSSALPDGGAPVHVRDVQDVRRRPGVWRYTGGVLRSDDGGRTWGRAGRSRRRRTPTATRTTRCGGTRASPGWRPASSSSATTRSATRRRTEGPVHIAWSPDDGATWTAPTSTGLPGQATYPLPLPDGRLVVFQQRRAETQIDGRGPSRTTAAAPSNGLV